MSRPTAARALKIRAGPIRSRNIAPGGTPDRCRVRRRCFDLDRTLCVSDQNDDAIHDAIFARIDPAPFFTPEDVFSVTPDELPEWDTETERFRLLYREICERKGIDPASKPLETLAGAAAVGMASAWVPLADSKVPEGDVDADPTYRLESMADLPAVIEGV
jgi:hypothetical protein